jgi:hypothetical protein
MTSTIDTGVQAYAFDGSSAVLYDLTTSGQVKQTSGNLAPPVTWSGLNSGYTASQIVAPRAPNPCGSGTIGGGLYMLAQSSPFANAQVWQYGGSAGQWTALTGTNTVVGSIASSTIASTTITGMCPNPTCSLGTVSTTLYMIAQNSGGSTRVWKYNGTPNNWTPITGANTTVLEMQEANGIIYMLASNNGGNYQVWMWYNVPGTTASWAAVTPSTWNVTGMWVAGEIVYIEQAGLVWQYVPPTLSSAPTATSANWISLTNSNTVISTSANSLLVQDGIEFFMLANNGGAGNGVYEFRGIGQQTSATSGWQLDSDRSLYNTSMIRLGTSDLLQMYASKSGGAWQWYTYGGSPLSWH